MELVFSGPSRGRLAEGPARGNAEDGCTGEQGGRNGFEGERSRLSLAPTTFTSPPPNVMCHILHMGEEHSLIQFNPLRLQRLSSLVNDLQEASKAAISKRTEGEPLTDNETHLLEATTRELLEHCREQIQSMLSLMFDEPTAPPVNVAFSLPPVPDKDEELFADTARAAKEGQLDGGKTLKKDAVKTQVRVTEWMHACVSCMYCPAMPKTPWGSKAITLASPAQRRMSAMTSRPGGRKSVSVKTSDMRRTSSAASVVDKKWCARSNVHTVCMLCRLKQATVGRPCWAKLSIDHPPSMFTQILPACARAWSM